MKEKNPGLVNQSTGDLTVDFVVVPGYGNISNYSRVNVDGKVAVVSRGGNVSFEQKVRNAMQRGAVGCVIYNNVSGIIRMSLGNISNPIPTCSITAAVPPNGTRHIPKGLVPNLPENVPRESPSFLNGGSRKMQKYHYSKAMEDLSNPIGCKILPL